MNYDHTNPLDASEQKTVNDLVSRYGISAIVNALQVSLGGMRDAFEDEYFSRQITHCQNALEIAKEATRTNYAVWIERR